MTRFIRLDDRSYMNLQHVYKFRAQPDGVYSITIQHDPDVHPVWVRCFACDSQQESEQRLDDLMWDIRRGYD